MISEPPDTTMLIARLDELEIRQAFQEDTIEQLSEIIARQDENLRQLHRLFKETTQQMEAITVQLEPEEADVPPPHY
ncbi:MAG: SlyX family protein [Natronospirillum sp.]